MDIISVKFLLHIKFKKKNGTLEFGVISDKKSSNHAGLRRSTFKPDFENRVPLFRF